jgi:hypothetical protein
MGFQSHPPASSVKYDYGFIDLNRPIDWNCPTSAISAIALPQINIHKKGGSGNKKVGRLPVRLG